jgi:hypothetical protein
MEQQTTTGQAQEARRFSDACEQFGEQMATWGEEFGRHMETWGREFGQRMEALSEELAQKLELAGERIREWQEEQRVSSAASASNLREERLAILRMVEEGKISVTEAESLLRALGE